MPPLRVAVAGATGYAGEELIRILHRHPSVSLSALAASAKWDRPVPVGEVFPRFAGLIDLPVESFDPERLASACDVAFLALPHGVSLQVVPALLSAGVRVVDLGGDFRLQDPALFEQWYGKPHTAKHALGEAVYGISELFADRIAKARLVANPGCYATSIILACAPLLKAGLVEPAPIIVDAKSGITGAGRKAEAHLMFSEMDENLWPYKVNKHQHTPEIVQALHAFAGGQAPAFCIVPHVVPLNRGILSSVYLRLRKPVSWEGVNAAYRAVYRSAPFVRIRGENDWPRLHDVANTNACHIGFAVDEAQGLLIVSSALDNLMKGAAGQAVQNMNLMCGWPETAGLL